MSLRGRADKRRFSTLVVLAIAVSVCSIAPSAGAVQPTFGRPRHDRTRSVDSKAPAPQEQQPKQPDPIPEWRDDDPPRAAPNPDAQPGKVYAWKTSDGLRYAWSLPFGFQPRTPYNVVFLLHPAGSDFRWGFGSHPRDDASASPPGGFRPGDIVVSLDGSFVEPRRGARWFEISPAALLRFRDVMLEFARELPVNRMYLYGSGGIDDRATQKLADTPAPASAPAPHAGDDDPPAAPKPGARLLSGGGAFATAFAGAFPALCDGLVAHASGFAPTSSSTVPIVFLHGAKDAATPLSQSLDALREYTQKKHPCARLRIMRGFNDFPNPVRASEALDFIDGLRTDDPADVLARARSLLAPKPADEFDYTAPVWYAGAYEILSRLTADPPDPARPFTDQPTDAHRAQARAWQLAIDAEAQAHIQALGPLLNSGNLREVPLDGGPWLGYLLAFRDDFRTVPACERFAAAIGFDTVAAEHADTAHELLDAWREHAAPGGAAAAERYRAAIDLVPRAFLYEGLPVDLLPYARACTKKAAELALAPDETARFEFITLWDKACRDGLDHYAQRWRRWEAPVPIQPPEAGTPE